MDTIFSQIFEFKDNTFKSIAFHPTNQLLATASDTFLQLWRINPNTNQPFCVATIDNKIKIQKLVFHPSAPLLATLSETDIKIWILSYHQAWIWNFGLFWTLEEYEPSPPFIKLDYSLSSNVEFHPTVPIIAISSLYKSFIDIFLLSNIDFSNFVISDNEEQHKYSFNRPQMSHLDFSAKHVFSYRQYYNNWALKFEFVPSIHSPLIAICPDKGLVELYSISLENWSFNLVWQHQIVVKHHEYVFTRKIRCLAVHPTGPILIIGCEDKSIILLHMSDDKTSVVFHTEVPNEMGHLLNSIKFHPTLPIFVGVSPDKGIVFWLISNDMRSATYLTNIDNINVSEYESFAFHPSYPFILINNPKKAILYSSDLLDPTFPNYILYTKYIDIFDRSACNKLCPFCNFKICFPDTSNPNNNINGYVVYLGGDKNYFYIHYNCLYRCLINENADIMNEIKIKSKTIETLLNLEEKSLALIGANFYNAIDIISEDFEHEIVNDKELWGAEILRQTKVLAENKKTNKVQMELAEMENRRESERQMYLESMKWKSELSPTLEEDNKEYD